MRSGMITFQTIETILKASINVLVQRLNSLEDYLRRIESTNKSKVTEIKS